VKKEEKELIPNKLTTITSKLKNVKSIISC